MWLRTALRTGGLCTLLWGCAAQKDVRLDLLEQPTNVDTFAPRARAYVNKGIVDFPDRRKTIELSGGFYYLKERSTYNADSSVVCHFYVHENDRLKHCTYKVCKNDTLQEYDIRTQSPLTEFATCWNSNTPERQKHLKHLWELTTLLELDTVRIKDGSHDTGRGSSEKYRCDGVDDSIKKYYKECES